MADQPESQTVDQAEDQPATPTETQTEKQKKNPWPLRIILLVILALMIAALVRDRWANQQYLQAWERIDKLQNEKNERPGELTTGPEDVAETIGNTAAHDDPEPVDHYYRQMHTWWRGLPWRQYYICVIYQKVKDKPILYAAFQGRMPDERELPTKPLQHADLLEASEQARREAEAQPGDQTQGDGTEPPEPTEPTEPAGDPGEEPTPTEPAVDPTEETTPAEPTTEPAAVPADESAEEPPGT
jgi:hypothetical protein